MALKTKEKWLIVASVIGLLAFIWLSIAAAFPDATLTSWVGNFYGQIGGLTNASGSRAAALSDIPSSLISNNLDTNPVGTSPADGWPLVSFGGLPKWTNTFNLATLNATNLALQSTIQTNVYGTSTNNNSIPVISVMMSNNGSLYPQALQWTNTSVGWVLEPYGLPIFPVADGIPTNNSGQAIAGYYSVYDGANLSIGALSQWTDIGPYAHNLFSGGGATSPTVVSGVASRNMVAFTNAAFAATQWMTNHTYTSPAVATEIFVTLYQDPLTTSRENLLSPDNAEVISSDGYIYVNNSGDYRVKDGGTELGGGTAGILPVQKIIVFDFVSQNGGAAAVYTNNVICFNGGSTGVKGITNSIALGAPPGAAVNGWAGKVGAVLIYTNILSAGDRTFVYGYETNRYH